MKQTAQRTSLIVGLAIFAVLWTGLMSLGEQPTSPTRASPPGVSSAAATGASGVHITYVDDSRFPELTVYLAVNDSRGQPLLGLSQADFTLAEDGQAVDLIGFVGAGGQAATVMLVIDTSGSMDDQGKMAGAIQAANTFIGRLQPGQDRAGVIVFDNSIDMLAPLQVVTAEGQQRLQQQIGRLYPGGGTEFYRAVQEGIRQLSAQSGRKVVLALTDGMDNKGQFYLSRTIRQAVDARVPVYTIGLGRDVDASGLQRLAQRSGGAYHFSPNAGQLEALYQEIASGLRNEYALTYRSLTPSLDGTRRKLDVEIGASSGPLSTQGGYQVGGILASSLNWGLFLPLFLALLLGVAVLYRLPRWRQRRASEGATAVPRDGPRTTGPPPHVQEPERRLASKASEDSVLPVAGGGAAGMVLVQQLPLPGGPAVVGSGPDCTVVIDHPSLAPRHIHIGLTDNRYVLDDVSGGRTWVSYSGDPAQLRPVQRNALRDGSLLQLGEVRLTFRQAETGAWLERRYGLPAAGLVLGSAAQADIVVPGGAAQQARVRQDNGRWVVETLRNGGVFVSYGGDPARRQPVRSRNALKPGSLLWVGTVRLRLEQA